MNEVMYPASGSLCATGFVSGVDGLSDADGIGATSETFDECERIFTAARSDDSAFAECLTAVADGTFEGNADLIESVRDERVEGG